MARAHTGDGCFRDRMAVAINGKYPLRTFEHGEVRYAAKRLVGALLRTGWTHERIERYISAMDAAEDVTGGQDSHP